MTRAPLPVVTAASAAEVIVVLLMFGLTAINIGTLAAWLGG